MTTHIYAVLDNRGTKFVEIRFNGTPCAAHFCCFILTMAALCGRAFFGGGGEFLFLAGGARFARGARFFRLGGGDGGFDDPAVKRE